jgi:Zn-dependent M28 family amino/carboxypeptidase
MAMLAHLACRAPGSTESGAAGAPPQRNGIVPLSQLPDPDMAAILAHDKVLSSDEFEGRAPGTAGEQKTVAYLTDQFKAVGLTPGNVDGSYVQRVPLVGISAAPAPLVVEKGAIRQTFEWKREVVAWTKHVDALARIDRSELVFVGYGVVAPEFNWDDYKGVDLRGKTLVVLINDPPVPDPANPSELDPKTFGGRAMTYYGRWTYKYEIGAQKGASGVLIVHETGPAGYPFDIVRDSFTGERFDLVTQDRNMNRAQVEGWVSLEAGRRLFALAGRDFDALKKEAATRAFKPVPLGVTASMTIRNRLRTIASQNVLGTIEGSDPGVKNEFVIYTAHWDHFGRNATGIFHGAVDNGLGCAALIEIARAFTRLVTPPRRSILFLAVTAEEQGLLGSEYYAEMPVYPLERTLADVNMDSWNVYGRTSDVTLVGYGASDLDDYAQAAAAEQGRVVHGDAEPEKGYFYRSDHFSFAKRGVPALNPEGGIEYVGKPADYGRRVRDEWIEHRYHKPADVVRPDWDLSGMQDDLKVYFAVGYRVAQAARFPEWKPGTEFKGARDAMLRR